MRCADLQLVLPLYLESATTPQQSADCDAHLQICPLCRLELGELRALTRDLGLLARPVPPPALATGILRAVQAQAIAAPLRFTQPRRAWHETVRDWLRPRLVPYSVASLASILLFIVSFAALRSSLSAFHKWDTLARQASAQETQEIQTKEFYGYDINEPLTPAGLAALRGPVSGESPTLNPRGALAIVMRSLTVGGNEDEMMVVADIFSDGSASLAGVVQPPRDPRLLQNVQRALRQNPAFVPAGYDGRPSTIRVVFVVQSIDVK